MAQWTLSLTASTCIWTLHVEPNQPRSLPSLAPLSEAWTVSCVCWPLRSVMGSWRRGRVRSRSVVPGKIEPVYKWSSHCKIHYVVPLPFFCRIPIMSQTHVSKVQIICCTDWLLSSRKRKFHANKWGESVCLSWHFPLHGFILACPQHAGMLPHFSGTPIDAPSWMTGARFSWPLTLRLCSCKKWICLESGANEWKETCGHTNVTARIFWQQPSSDCNKMTEFKVGSRSQLQCCVTMPQHPDHGWMIRLALSAFCDADAILS